MMRLCFGRIFITVTCDSALGQIYWTPSIPRQGLVPFFRFYGTGKPLLERTWKLPDFENLK